MHCFSVCVGWYVGPTHASVSDTGRNGWGVEIYLHPAHYFDEVKVFGASNWVQLNIRSRFYFDSIRVCECECVWGGVRTRACVRACVRVCVVLVSGEYFDYPLLNNLRLFC